jgi:hypothetical protein
LFDRVLITGGGGMLGAAVYDTFKAVAGTLRATDIDCDGSWLEFLDVRDQANCAQFFGEPGLDSMRDWRVCLTEYARTFAEAGLGKI